MRAMIGTMRAELVGAGGVVERNAYLTRRYIWWDLAWFVWTVANTLTIVFIAKGIEAEGGSLDVNETMTTLHQAVVWASPDPLRVLDGDRRLGALGGDDRVRWRRSRGPCTLPARACSRSCYGLLRAFLFVICGFVFFDLSMPDAQFFAAFVVLLVASVSFIGIGMMMSSSRSSRPRRARSSGSSRRAPLPWCPASTTWSRCRSGCSG